MAKMIQKLVNKQQSDSAAAVSCNYQNNYYGDQVCVMCKPAQSQQQELQS